MSYAAEKLGRTPRVYKCTVDLFQRARALTKQLNETIPFVEPHPTRSEHLQLGKNINGLINHFGKKGQTIQKLDSFESKRQLREWTIGEEL